MQCQAWLRSLQLGNEDSAAFDLCEGLPGSQPFKCSAQRLQLWWRFLRWSLQVQLEVRFAAPELVYTWTLCKAEEQNSLEAAIVVPKQERALKLLCEISERFTAPIFSDEGGGHWTLLAVERTPLCNMVYPLTGDSNMHLRTI